jgi:hypothetical protein
MVVVEGGGGSVLLRCQERMVVVGVTVGGVGRDLGTQRRSLAATIVVVGLNSLTRLVFLFRSVLLLEPPAAAEVGAVVKHVVRVGVQCPVAP